MVNKMWDDRSFTIILLGMFITAALIVLKVL